MKNGRVVDLAALVLAGSMLVPLGTQAASLDDLAKIKVKVTKEKEVRAILGEPVNIKEFIKPKWGGRVFQERRDLIYRLADQEVVIRIDPKNKLVVRIIAPSVSQAADDEQDVEKLRFSSP